MFCAPGLAFGCTMGVGSGFHVLRARTRFGRYRRCQVPFSCLRSPARFQRCGGIRVPFSCFAPPDSFSAVPRASGPFSLFYEPVFVFGGTEDVGTHFNVLRDRTHFRLYRGRRLPFSCFALPDSFSALPRASAPVFMFCAPGLAFGGTEGVGSCTFSAVLNSFSAVPTASGLVFMFCVLRHVFVGVEGVGSRFLVLCPGLVFGGSEGVESRFYIFGARTHFRQYRGRLVLF
jgi:hypothetical protein